MHGNSFSGVIQGFFVGAPRRPGPAPATVARQGTAPAIGQHRPGAPAPAFGSQRGAVQAKPAPGRPLLAHQRGGTAMQAHGVAESFEVDPVQIGLSRGGGNPLPQALLAKMEAALGADFSAVRVHVGPQASRIGALAFTLGEQLYFAPGQYQPETVKGQQLIGHELTHVIQQRQGRVRAPGSGVSVVQDRSLEAEADRMGARAAAHRGFASPQAGAARPGAPVRAAAMQCKPVVPGRIVQRAQQFSAPPFKLNQLGIDLVETMSPTYTGKRAFKTYSQDDLFQDPNKPKSTSKRSQGRKAVRGTTVNVTAYFDVREEDARAGGKVVSYIKANGKLVALGDNNKAAKGVKFQSGVYNQSTKGGNSEGLKINFHAEDWAIKTFKDRYSQSGYDSLDQWLESKSSKNNNVGNKHFISMAVSACPCMGCAISLRGFKQYLDRELGADNFIFRLKFLRPYSLSSSITNSDSNSSENFTSTLGILTGAHISVRFQNLRSAKNLMNRNLKTAKPITEAMEDGFAFNHPGVNNSLNPDQLLYLNKTWTQQGFNRKPVPGTVTVQAPVFVLPPPTMAPPPQAQGGIGNVPQLPHGLGQPAPFQFNPAQLPVQHNNAPPPAPLVYAPSAPNPNRVTNGRYAPY